MKKIRTLIVDDEPLARKTLRLLMEKDDEIELIGECRNGVEAVEQITRHLPELVFLDVQMPQMGGFDVVRAVGAEKMPLTVFVTAYDSYALKAFEAEALDYLLKPFEDARFGRTISRAKKILQGNGNASQIERVSSLLHKTNEHAGSVRPASRLMISTNGKIVFLKTEEIDWINALDYYVRIYAQNRSYLQRETMDRLEKKLDPAKFRRIHRSTIVNIDRVKELQPSFNGNYVAILHDGKKLKVSRRRRQQLMELL